MPQQADGWQEPEFEALGVDGEIAATLPWLNGPNLGGSDLDLLHLKPEGGRVPWLESVAASHSSDAWSGWVPNCGISGSYPSGLDTSAWNPLPGASTLPASGSETIASLIHDARNLITTIDLYCDLLEVPGVLSTPFRSYSGDLRLMSSASRRLLEKLAAIEMQTTSSNQPANQPASGQSTSSTGSAQNVQCRNVPYLADPYFFDSPTPAQWEAVNQTTLSGISLVGKQSRPRPIPSAKCRSIQLESPSPAPSETLVRRHRAQSFITHQPIQSLADELMANQRLLSALSGPGITLGLTIDGGDRRLPLAADDLTRVLVNLVKNASEAMPTGGHIQITLVESSTQLDLTVTDSGPGIPASQLESIFAVGYSTQIAIHPSPVAWQSQHRGLGLAIVRSIVTSAGGTIRARNADSQPAPTTDRSPSDPSKRSDPFTSSLPSTNPTNPPKSEVRTTGAIFCMSFPLSADQDQGPTFQADNESESEGWC